MTDLELETHHTIPDAVGYLMADGYIIESTVETTDRLTERATSFVSDCQATLLINGEPLLSSEEIAQFARELTTRVRYIFDGSELSDRTGFADPKLWGRNADALVRAAAEITEYESLHIEVDAKVATGPGQEARNPSRITEVGSNGSSMYDTILGRIKRIAAEAVTDEAALSGT